MEKANLREKAIELLKIRVKVDDLSDEHEDAFVAMETTIEGRECADLQKLLNETMDKQKAIEQELRELTVAYYEETGDKHPLEGLDVRVNKTVRLVSEQAALAWAEMNSRVLIKYTPPKIDKAKLRTGILQGFVPETVEININEEPTEIRIAEVVEKPSAAIGKGLARLLDAEPTPAEEVEPVGEATQMGMDVVDFFASVGETVEA